MRVSDMYPNGIQEYTRAMYTEEIPFPYDNVCCAFCRKLARKDTGQLYCRLTNEVLHPDVISAGVGGECPLEIQREETKADPVKEAEEFCRSLDAETDNPVPGYADMPF